MSDVEKDPQTKSNNPSDMLQEKQGMNMIPVIVAVCVALVLVVAGIVVVLCFANGSDSGKNKNENVIVYDNGDRVYRPGKENIVIDSETSIEYFNNLLIVYNFTKLDNSRMKELEEAVNGQIVGEISGEMNIVQIKVEPSTLSELIDMSNKLMEFDYVLFATYEDPVRPEVQSTDKNPWTSQNGTPESDKGNESDPQGGDWWAEAVGAYTAWNCGLPENPVKMGVLDSGYQLDHEDLKGRIQLLKMYDENSEDDHGTHVAGIMGAANNDKGIRGICDDAPIVCCDWSPKGDGSADDSYLDNGEYASVIKQMVENDVRVINNSWGCAIMSEEAYRAQGSLWGTYEEYVQSYRESISSTGKNAMMTVLQLLINGEEDFIIVQSAGNGADNGSYGVDAYFAGSFTAITEDTYNSLGAGKIRQLEEMGINYKMIEDRIMIVGAAENNRDSKGNYKMTYFSNFGEQVDICAPGAQVLSCIVDGYCPLDGTSMAAPIVSACIAKVWSWDNSLTASQVREILLSSAKVKALGVDDGKKYSYPMVNIGEATKLIGKVEDTEPSTAPKDSTPADEVVEIYLSNIGVWIKLEGMEAQVCRYGFADLNSDGILELIADITESGSNKTYFYTVDTDSKTVIDYKGATEFDQSKVSWITHGKFTNSEPDTRRLLFTESYNSFA